MPTLNMLCCTQSLQYTE